MRSELGVVAPGERSQCRVEIGVEIGVEVRVERRVEFHVPEYDHGVSQAGERLGGGAVGYVRAMTSITTHPTRADALVVFGLTGDLGAKKLFPALYELAAAGLLAMPVIGVGRTEYSDAELRTMLEDALDDHEPADGAAVDSDVVASIELAHVAGDSTDPSTYDALSSALGDARCPVLYAALPPGMFGDVARGISRSTLPDTTRLVTEKPFGSNARSARELFDEITEELDATNLFIVDHFLAKAAIENMLTVRTANPLIENSMCARFVQSIDIEMTESGGVDGRGSFYESVGAVGDVLQNHLLQMLATLTMEQPTDDSAAAMLAARTELLRAVRPMDPAHTVLGQYHGYRDLDDVPDDSDVETFVAARTTIENDRWSGVPVTLRTGKRLRSDSTAATITLASTSTSGDAEPTDHQNGEEVVNRIHFGVKPDASIAIDLAVLDPEDHGLTPVTAGVCGPGEHGPLGDYAVMLDNAMNGDQHHFAHIDGVTAAWQVVEPISSAGLEVHRYPEGSDGPHAADRRDLVRIGREVRRADVGGD